MKVAEFKQFLKGLKQLTDEQLRELEQVLETENQEQVIIQELE